MMKALGASTLTHPSKLYIQPLFGFGDHLYLRPFVLAATEHYEVYIDCAYPELYKDTSVHVVNPGNREYSFSDMNAERDLPWAPKPSKPYKYIRNHYTVEQLRSGQTIPQVISAGFPRGKMSTRLVATEAQRLLAHELVSTTKPIMVVKMPSHAQDWNPTSRSPKTEYMVECLRMAKKAGYHLVSICGKYDVFDDPRATDIWVPLIDTFLHDGLSIDQLIGLHAIADKVLSYPNFTLPLCISLETPLFTVFGGHVSPDRLVDPRMGATKWRYVAPNPFCNCVKNQHECNKEMDMEYVRAAFGHFLDEKIQDELLWDEARGYGYYPVKNDGVYNDAYFDKYVGYEQSDLGKQLTAERVKLAERYKHGGRILDFGIGSGQFVKESNSLGYDVCPKAVEWLKKESRLVNPWTDDLWSVDAITFFDSFEHEDNIDELVRKVWGRTLILSIPIFKDKAHVLRSKHFRKDEHYHYFTQDGLIRWFADRNYHLVEANMMETKLGREDIFTFVFQPNLLATGQQPETD